MRHTKEKEFEERTESLNLSREDVVFSIKFTAKFNLLGEAVGYALTVPSPLGDIASRTKLADMLIEAAQTICEDEEDAHLPIDEGSKIRPVPG